MKDIELSRETRSLVTEGLRLTMGERYAVQDGGMDDVDGDETEINGSHSFGITQGNLLTTDLRLLELWWRLVDFS